MAHGRGPEPPRPDDARAAYRRPAEMLADVAVMRESLRGLRGAPPGRRRAARPAAAGGGLRLPPGPPRPAPAQPGARRARPPRCCAPRGDSRATTCALDEPGRVAAPRPGAGEPARPLERRRAACVRRRPRCWPSSPSARRAPGGAGARGAGRLHRVHDRGGERRPGAAALRQGGRASSSRGRGRAPARSDLHVVPLFETIDDLHRCAGLMRELLRAARLRRAPRGLGTARSR